MAHNYFREMADLTVEQFDLCPFCGKSIIVEKEEDSEIYSIECDECDTSLGPFVSLTHAYLVWHRRATTTDDAAVPVEIVETIKSALRHTRNDLDTEYFTVTIRGRNREMVDKALAWLDSQRKEATDAN